MDERVNSPGRRGVALAGAFNVRDLGGLRTINGRVTRPGLVYRADCLDWLTAADREELFERRRVGTLIDLRTHRESGGDGLADARRFPEVRSVSIPLIPDDRIDLDPFPVGDPIAVAHHYLGYLNGAGSPAVEILAEIAKSVAAGEPVLFHCAAGRDRTGVVAAVLLTLLGVVEPEIVDDYLISNLSAAAVNRHLQTNPLYQRSVQGQSSGRPGRRGLVERRTIRHFLRLLGQPVGGARRWALQAGLEPALLANLRASLVAGTRERLTALR